MIYDMVISGRLVDTTGSWNANIGITKERIMKVSGNPLQGKAEIVCEDTQLIFPGFIDPHVHLREPGWEHMEDFASGGAAALNGGVTTVADMPNLPMSIINKERLLKKIALAEKSPVEILHIGGVNKNNLDDAKDIANLVPCFKIYTAESTGELTLNGWDQIEQATKLISDLKKPVTFHCEDQNIIDAAKKSVQGDYEWKHCDQRPKESEISAVSHVISFCKKYGTKANIAHVSCAESIAIIGENKPGVDLICEATSHHLYFTKYDMKKYGNLLQVNCPLREEKDRKALLRGIKKGVIDMLATDHAPHTLQENNPASAPCGMPGLDTYGNIVLWLLIEQKIKPERIAEVTSFNAANYLGLRSRALIKENFLADLSILDRAGETMINKDELKTKCKWSAFEGKTFPGMVVGTIVRGKPYLKK